MTWQGLSPPYSTIVADPPWQFNDDWCPYSTMTTDQIGLLPVYELSTSGTHLYLWTTNEHLWLARQIVMAWGFSPVQVLVWCKAPRGMGTCAGASFANTAEFVVFARRAVKTEPRRVERAGQLIREAREASGLGRAELHRLVRGGKPTGIVFRWEADDCLPTQADWKRLQEALPALASVECPEVEPPPPKPYVPRTQVDRSWWEWKRGPHSTKPPAFFDIVEQVSPPPYVELFARQPRLGWDSWGHGFEATA